MRADKASRFKVAKQTDAVGEGAMVATLTGRDDPLFKSYYCTLFALLRYLYGVIHPKPAVVPCRGRYSQPIHPS